MTAPISPADDSAAIPSPAPLDNLRDSTCVNYGILADDLTGALDVAAQFAMIGFSASVVMDRRYRNCPASSITVVSTNSRNDSVEMAREKVLQAMDWFAEREIRLVYKKIDSTCKGNIVSEIEAVREATRRPIIFCPANPAQGRIVRDSQLFVRDDCQLDLENYLRSHGCDRFARLCLPLSAKRWGQVVSPGNSLVVADAVTESDLEDLARFALESAETALLVGSAGLAKPYAKWLARQDKTFTPTSTSIASAHTSISPTPSDHGRPCLLFIGSTNQITLRQVEILAHAGQTEICECTQAGAVKAQHAIANGRHVVVRIPVFRQPDSIILQSINCFVDAIRTNPIGSIVLSGGDTAAQVCRTLEPQAIQVFGELLPGLAYGKFVGGLADGISACTKPGGFGDDDSLLKAVTLLTAML